MIDEEEEIEDEDTEEEHTCWYCGEELDEDQGDFCSKQCAIGYKQDN